MGKTKVIVIGASSGGVEALTELFQNLRPDLNASIFIVVHIAQDVRSYLPGILSRAGTIPAAHAVDAGRIEPGRAYVAPPGWHLLVQDGVMHLAFGPKENGFRPAIDPLFQSAAASYGPDVIGVVLSGSLHDGTRGLLAIERAGGTTVVQDPEEALFPSMPASALQYTEVDYSLPVSKIASLLNEIAGGPLLEKGGNPVKAPLVHLPDDETAQIKKDFEQFEKGADANGRSLLTCPDCGGVLWELKDGDLVRYRCHIGHVYSPDMLLASQNSELENAFWEAIRHLVEKAALANRLAIRAKSNGKAELEAHYLKQAVEAEKSAGIIRRTWLNGAAERSKEASAGEAANQEISRTDARNSAINK